MRVLYVNPLPEGGNPAIDALAYGLAAAVRQAGGETRVLTTDFRLPDIGKQTADAFDAAVAAGVDAIVMYALDPTQPAEAAARARAAGVRVVSLVQPDFEVDGAVLYPNFNQGLFMATWLAARLTREDRIGIIGGPGTADDNEEVAGLLYGFRRAGIPVVNDPGLAEWRNMTDVADGGHEVAVRLLAQHPEITALVPYNDESMLGTLRALDGDPRLGRLPMVSRNAAPKAVQAVRDGLTSGTWDIEPTGIGWAAGALAARVLNGDAAPGELVMSPVGRMVHAGNLDTWKPWEQRVDWRPLVHGLD
ncbi:sugar ABC transporter substrate-binding protein [Geodermatophilus ruber]|uniref:ABC-type sugar transport system, substrate-binding protein, contains N-terminal xre family HTH domain n=1 Tax=Geodermatophilus ruber TaxID=504800 RepID=A0A1I4GNE9_9ACTN|nr:substrate-binding domain-containing protein [Geodermatophilus ruber]SFL30691.1 ABC-type sugar transport system, substrate-binding protein, contains N-terminal xre family HTH domain [Geodermatophilus ruber]